MARYARQSKEWQRILSTNQSMTADATFVTSSLSFLEASTILRMIGEYTIAARTAPTALDSAKVAVGLAVVSTDAAAVGATAMPDPAGEPEYPWFYWAEHSFFCGDNLTIAGNHPSGLRKSYDIRSMRKVKPRESLVFVFQYVDIVGAPNLIMQQSQVRVLIGLH